MGLISHLFTMGIGAYAGAFVAQNYDIPKLLAPSEINTKSIEDAAGTQLQNISDTISSFQIPVVPSLQQLSKKLEDYLEQFKKSEEK